MSVRNDIQRTLILTLAVVCTGCAASQHASAPIAPGDSWDTNGTVTVRGYAEVTDDPVPYVFVILTEVSSPSFAAYLEQMYGNAFADTDRIGVGCLQNRDIHAVRFTAYGDMQAVQLPPMVTQAILASRPEMPVTLQLSASGWHGAGVAPNCFSHFVQINLGA